MRRINIAQITVLLFAANAMGLAALHHQATAKATGQLRGTVVDTNDARIAGATVTVEGEGVTLAVMTADDGTYKIELPSGIYRIRVNSTGFCPARRAPFRMQPSNTIMLNFNLKVCPIVNGITIVDGQYVGETDRYQDPLREEVIPLAHLSGAPLELLVRYGERREDGNFIDYRGATVSYDALTIRADKVRLNPSTFRLEAESNVFVEDGKRCVRVKRAIVDLRTGEPKLELTQ
jgi:hypothetical protein